MVRMGERNRRKCIVRQNVSEDKKVENITVSVTCGYARYSVCNI
jgi:hypothetical protein